MSLEKSLLERIYAKVDIDEITLCFRYMGGNNGKQYGRTYARGKNWGVHRLIYTIFFGPIPTEKEVHHLCGTRNCCNIAHLQLVTHRENVIKTPQYEQRRWERLQDLLGAHLDLALLGVTHVKSTDLRALWKDCRSQHVPKYLTTLAAAFQGDFAWTLLEKGRGRRPSRFQLRMSRKLIEQLEASALETLDPAQDILTHTSSLAVA
jgi:hypothetical protein